MRYCLAYPRLSPIQFLFQSQNGLDQGVIRNRAEGRLGWKPINSSVSNGRVHVLATCSGKCLVRAEGAMLVRQIYEEKQTMK